MTIPLPPEIKSAEDFYWRELVDNPHHVNTSNADLAAINKINQRDLAIWNAAIEKAAEYCEQRRKSNEAQGSTYLAGESLDCKRGVLNLKRKE